ncbi:hypothetical protein Tco_0259138, partial [Tanacetum coccineum]
GIPIEGWMMMENKHCGKLLKVVLMIDELSIVETDKVNHNVEMDILKLVVEVMSVLIANVAGVLTKCNFEVGITKLSHRE